MDIRVIIQLLDLVVVDLKNSTDLEGWYTKAVTNQKVSNSQFSRAIRGKKSTKKNLVDSQIFS